LSSVSRPALWGVHEGSDQQVTERQDDSGQQAQRDRQALVSRLEKGVFGSAGGGSGRFATARRGGYDPEQVESHVAELNGAIREQTERAEAAEAQLAGAREQASQAAPAETGTVTEGMAARIEKILHLAEA
jgi:hypothetical protein